jgi:hypothetical protein
MSFLGHSTPDEARTYVKKANRKRLADSGLGKVARELKRRHSSNRKEKLDKVSRKALKNKDKTDDMVRPRGIEPLFAP